MRRSTLYLFVALLALGVTDLSYDLASMQQRKVDEIQAELDVERIARQEEIELYRNQLLQIVSTVYTQELRLGGYETIAGAEVTEMYDAVMNGIHDYREVLEETKNYFVARANYIAGLPSIWPVRYSTAIYVTSGYGTRYDPITGRFSFHPALDIAGPRGTVIIATADGEVFTHYPPPGEYFNGHDNLGGYVEVYHADGYLTRYAHMSRTFVHEGERVKRGQVIGVMGSTGTSTGIHLHYEVMRYGEYVDPTDLLQF